MTEDKIMFTEENWKRHMSVSDSFLITARNRKKCPIWYKQIFLDGNYWICVGVYSYPFNDYVEKLWKIEGFSSADELRAELQRIYGNDMKTVYSHQFTRINSVGIIT